MSAIAGVIDLYTDERILNTMFSTMRRRGPDGQGCYQTPGAVLFHTGLTESQPQPMTLEWGAERYVLTMNGTLYNSAEIRQELMKLGHCFVTLSDAEVVLRAYAQWKQEALQKLNGVFAFAVLEERRGRLFLARDRIGVKPLFFMGQREGMLFASEMKTILTYPGVEARVNAEGVGQLVLLGPGRLPGSGVFTDMRELEPGCMAYWEDGNLQIKRYWKLRDREHTDSLEETAETVRELVLDAIGRQLVTDAPVGCFLSGGLDSSIICAVASREMERQGKRLHTFSLDYLSNDRFFTPGKFQPNSDTPYIGLMQDAVKSEHHWTVLEPQQLINAIADATVARDLPGMADVDASLLLFCQQIAPYAKVVLSGECADEIFGGYPWYRDPQMRDGKGFPWSRNTQFRSAFLHPLVKDRLQPEAFVMDAYEATLAQADILPENSPTERRMKEMVNLHFRWFMQTLIDRKDRMTMYHGMQARVPFCDYRIAEYLYGVPWEMKDFGGQEKGLLRYAMKDLLPDAVINRKKSPYPKTHDPAYLDMARSLLRGILAQKDAPILQIMERSTLESLLQGELPWPWYGQLMTMPQTIVYMVQINYWLEHYSVKFE